MDNTNNNYVGDLTKLPPKPKRPPFRQRMLDKPDKYPNMRNRLLNLNNN